MVSNASDQCDITGCDASKGKCKACLASASGQMAMSFRTTQPTRVIVSKGFGLTEDELKELDEDRDSQVY